MEQLGHPRYQTKEAAYDAFQRLSPVDRQHVWKSAARGLQKSEQQVRDFYYNTYVKQFFEDVSRFQHEIVQILQRNEHLSDADRIKVACQEVMESQTNVNPKALNKFVRKLLGQRSYSFSGSFESGSSSQASPAQPSQSEDEQPQENLFFNLIVFDLLD